MTDRPAVSLARYFLVYFSKYAILYVGRTLHCETSVQYPLIFDKIRELLRRPTWDQC